MHGKSFLKFAKDKKNYSLIIFIIDNIIQILYLVRAEGNICFPAYVFLQ